MDALFDNIREIRRRMKAAAGDRKVHLIAVTKTVPAERINLLVEAGQFSIGENRVQEILEKRPGLRAELKIDLIGRLQTNKVKYIIDKVAMIQSVDRLDLAEEICKRAEQHHLTMPVLVQVNIGDEEQKGGCPVGDTLRFSRTVSSLPGLELRGLMAVMPDLRDPEALRPYFRTMHTLFEQLRKERGPGISELSMGMSGDYVTALEEGATHVRIGSAIFGPRL